MLTLSNIGNDDVSRGVDIIVFNYKNELKAPVSTHGQWGSPSQHWAGHLDIITSRHHSKPVNDQPHFTAEEIKFKGIKKIYLSLWVQVQGSYLESLTTESLG